MPNSTKPTSRNGARNPHCSAEPTPALAHMPAPSAAPAAHFIGHSTEAAVHTYFENGVLVISGNPPKPLHHWAISVDRNDGKGDVFLCNQTLPAPNQRPRFLDYHELPAAPTMWTYTIVPMDADGHPIARDKQLWLLGK